MEQLLIGPEKFAGLLLTAPFGLTMLFILYIAFTQKRNMFRPSPQNLVKNEKVSRFGSIMGIIGMTCTLIGFTVLTVLSQDNERDFVSILALVLFGLTTIFWLIDMNMNISVRI